MKFVFGFLFAVGAIGWILGGAQAFKPAREVVVPIPATPSSYSHARSLCSLTREKGEVGVEVVDVKGWVYKVPCRVLKLEEGERR